MRVLGLDIGEKRVGLAVSDPMGWNAHSYSVMQRSSEEKEFLYLKNVCKEMEIMQLVVGLPKNMDGSIGFRGEATFAFIEELKKLTTLPIITWDERLSTVSAIKSLNETNTRGKKRKEVVDTVAAMYILQNYLDSI